MTTTEPAPAYTILTVTHTAGGGADMVIRKAGGQLRKVRVPARLVNGPDLVRLAADMIDGWPPRPPDATGR